MKKLFLALILVANLIQASEIKDDQAVERFSVHLHGLQICHQEEWRNLSIDLEYASDESDAQAVKTFAREFLEKYANPADFWEIVNVKLVEALATSMPHIEFLKTRLKMAPDSTLSAHRMSTVEFRRGADALNESFGFLKTSYLTCQETFRTLDLQVSWALKANPGAFDYPDYLWVDEASDQYFKEHPFCMAK